MQKSCKNCGVSFEITNDDFAFYKKMDVPTPTFCPDCRQQRRLARRNEKNLYLRTCDMCKNKVVSIYPDGCGFLAYCANCWWSDKWNSGKYGRDFDFNKPFFEQFEKLQKSVPRLALQNQLSVNSDYTNHAKANKNCYMCMDIACCEDCYYCTNFVPYCKNCVDCVAIQNCELCYDCIDARSSYASIGLLDCENCTDCAFLYNCIGCENCFMSYNLRHKKYYIRGRQASKKEYEKIRTGLSSSQNFEHARMEFPEFIKNAPRKYCTLKNCEENVIGDHIEHSKNISRGFYGFKCKDVKFAYDFGEMKDCYDLTEPWKGELQYETHACNDGYNLKFVSIAWDNSYLTYCDLCFNSHYLFGCVGMHNHRYHILNKEYSKEEYEKLVPKIIEYMKKTGEWGEFFPMQLSTFPYNETAAQEYYPLTREKVLALGLKWKNREPREYQKQTYKIPDNIADVPDKITNELLACESCGKNFKIVAQELTFYKQMGIPIPRKCFDCRHTSRMALRNPRKLWSRKCDNCGTEIQSVYDPTRPEKILCEKCYLEILD